MARLAILSLSDGRDFVHRDLVDVILATENAVANRLTEIGHEVVRVDEIVSSASGAVRLSRRIADSRPDLMILNIAVWAFPHFAAIAAREVSSPVVLFSNIDPQYPGMVGMLAAAGALEQIARPYERIWGDVSDPEVLRRLNRAAVCAAAVSSLRGATFGRIGGRPMGMYTAVSNTDQWMRQFGVDVEEIDQWELVRRSESVAASQAIEAREWLERTAAGVHYDGRQLTPDILERQIRSYYAMRELIDEWGLDFSGIKAQPELTNNFCTMDVTEAFLNDPYDWSGPKPIHVCSTEADMDGALTMQLLTRLSGTPVLFADLRHYHRDEGIWHLSNSGQHATWFSARSDDPAENMRRVHLFPQGFYFPAGGASVHHLAAPGPFTFARLTRTNGNYRMQVLRGALETFDAETNERLMRQTNYEWPHAFARFDASSDDVLSRYGCNHIHGVPGDFVTEIEGVCRLLGVEFELFAPPSR